MKGRRSGRKVSFITESTYFLVLTCCSAAKDSHEVSNRLGERTISSAKVTGSVAITKRNSVSDKWRQQYNPSALWWSLVLPDFARRPSCSRWQCPGTFPCNKDSIVIITAQKSVGTGCFVNLKICTHKFHNKFSIHFSLFSVQFTSPSCLHKLDKYLSNQLFLTLKSHRKSRVLLLKIRKYMYYIKY